MKKRRKTSKTTETANNKRGTRTNIFGHNFSEKTESLTDRGNCLPRGDVNGGSLNL